VSRWRPVLAVVVGFGAGAIPFSNVMARAKVGVDLRSVGTGTVSGTALAQVAGTGPLFIAGLFEVAKGAVGPALAGRDHPLAAAVAGAAGVVGHNWSPLLGGAGGRGISPAIGALLVQAPVGSLVLLAGLAGGRLAGETALGSLAADVALVPISGRAHGRAGRRAAAAVLVPVMVKRLLGNAAPARRVPGTYLTRFLFDRDTWGKASPTAAPQEPAS
jgi:acyl phosphate:glycerol-3-phosphate acyltransferase